MENKPYYEQLKKGTTTIAFKCTDGVVIASDSRATMGYLISDKNAQKIYPIGNNIGLTTAGLVGDNQALVRLMKAQSALYNMDGKPLTVKSAATLLSNILNQNRYYPFWVQLILAGADSDGGHVYEIDAAGGMGEKNVAATGSGSPTAYGVLETQYHDKLTVKEGVPIAARSIKAALERDAGTGNTIDVVTITKDGYKQVPRDEVKGIVESIPSTSSY